MGDHFCSFDESGLCDGCMTSYLGLQRDAALSQTSEAPQALLARVRREALEEAGDLAATFDENRPFSVTGVTPLKVQIAGAIRRLADTQGSIPAPSVTADASEPKKPEVIQGDGWVGVDRDEAVAYNLKGIREMIRPGNVTEKLRAPDAPGEAGPDVSQKPQKTNTSPGHVAVADVTAGLMTHINCPHCGDWFGNFLTERLKTVSGFRCGKCGQKFVETQPAPATPNAKDETP